MADRTDDPRRVARALADGEVVLLRTDTLPGLHARADRSEAVDRIRRFKGRAGDKPLLLLCASPEDALALAAESGAQARDYIGRCWPGPFTLVLPAGPTAPAAATRGGDTVAVRVPAPAGLRELIAEAGGALVSTSANLAGRPPETDLDAAAALCGEAVDVVADLDWDAGSPDAGASTLLDLTVWPPVVLRPGAQAPPDWQAPDVSP